MALAVLPAMVGLGLVAAPPALAEVVAGVVVLGGAVKLVAIAAGLVGRWAPDPETRVRAAYLG